MAIRQIVLEVLAFQRKAELDFTAPKSRTDCILSGARWPKWKSRLREPEAKGGIPGPHQGRYRASEMGSAANM